MMRRLFLACIFLAMALSSAAQQGVSSNNYFPVAVWLQDPADAMAYKANGINMYIGLWKGLDEKQLTDLKNANMKFICRQNAFGISRIDEPLIYGWMHDDEPDNAQLNPLTKKYDPCVDPSVIIKGYEEIKSRDPSRPVYLNLSQGVAWKNWYGRGTCTGNNEMYKIANNGYLKGCDIASFDIYPVNNSDPETQNNLYFVANGIDSLRLWSEDTKPAWCWIETTAIHPTSQRKPRPEEVKAEVWMALIRGAKGIGYFCHSFREPQDAAALLNDSIMIRAVKEINFQINSLAGVLNSPDVRGIASVSTDNKEVPVDIMTKSDGVSDYIFAVAMRNGMARPTFTVAEGKKVEVLGENRSIIVKNGKFRDNFAGYGVHLYRIER